MLTSIQSAGLALEMNLRITQARKHAIHPGFETQGRRHQKSKNRGISSPTKITYVLQKLKKKTGSFDFEVTKCKKHVIASLFYLLFASNRYRLQSHHHAVVQVRRNQHKMRSQHV